MGRLTTHVLDIAAGRPAAGLRVELLRPEGAPPLAVGETNRDGRVDPPLLEGVAFTAGIYELRFHAGDYLRRAGHQAAGTPFLGVIPIRFGVADAGADYHVPLLLSPYGYSTYRGS